MIVIAVAVGTLRPMGKVRPVWSVRGDGTSRIWNYDLTVDRISHGERWKSRAYDDGSLALLHRLEKGTYWDDEVESARSAIALADRREVRAARTIRQLLDTRETDPEPEIRPSRCSLGDLGVADVTLLDFIHDPDDRIEFVADEVGGTSELRLACFTAWGSCTWTSNRATSSGWTACGSSAISIRAGCKAGRVCELRSTRSIGIRNAERAVRHEPNLTCTP